MSKKKYQITLDVYHLTYKKEDGDYIKKVAWKFLEAGLAWGKADVIGEMVRHVMSNYSPSDFAREIIAERKGKKR